MQAVGVLVHVDRAYHQSEANQWAREAVVNSIQAGAKNVYFTVEWQAVAQKGVYRRMIADDGCGMTAQAMPAFLNKYGGSGRTIGDISGNYGIGLKTSTLPWNKYGLVVLSVTTTAEGKKCANMMWLCRGTTDEGFDYGARELVTEEFGDEDDFIEDWTSEFASATEALSVLPLDRLPDYGFEDNKVDGIDWLQVIPDFIWKAGHGTAIVFMGDTGAEDTINGDPSRSAENDAKYSLATYLNCRFYRLPKDVCIHTVTLESSKPQPQKNDWKRRELWPKKPAEAGVKRLNIVGMEACLERYVQKAIKEGEQRKGIKPPHVETVKLNGDSVVSANVTTYLYPDIGVSKPGQDSWTGYQAGDSPSIPLFACIHEAHPGIIEAFGVQIHAKGKASLYPWVNTDMVRRRLAIVVEPLSTEKTKVFPDPSRRTLHYQDSIKGGADMPLDDWTELYQKVRPAFVTKAIDEFFATFSSALNDTEVDEDLLRRIGDQYLPFMRDLVVRRKGRRRSQSDTDEDADVTHTPTGSGGCRIPSVPATKGGKNYKVAYGLLPATLIDIPVDPKDREAFPLVKNSDVDGIPSIEIHFRHPLIQAAWSACRQRLLQRNGVAVDQLTVYEEAFYREVKLHVQLAVTHTWQYVRSGRVALRDKVFTPEALLSIVAGIRPLQQAAQGVFGTLKAGKERQA